LVEKVEKVNKLKQSGTMPDAEMVASLKKLPELQRELDAIRAAITAFEEEYPEEVKRLEEEKE